MCGKIHIRVVLHIDNKVEEETCVTHQKKVKFYHNSVFEKFIPLTCGNDFVCR